MKILVVTHNISAGGAAIACRRLIAAFKSQKFEIKLMSIKEREFSSLLLKKVFRIYSLILSKIDIKICKFLTNENLHWQSSGLIGVLKARHIRTFNPDVVNIHWVGHATVSLRQLKKIENPVIITMHDEWWLNALNHYQVDTEFHKKSFIRNAVLNYIVKEKNQILNLPNVRIVCPSQELKIRFTDQVQEKHSKVHVIPNPASERFFYPMPNISKKSKILLFAGGTRDFRKGYDLLLEVLGKMKEICQVIVLGNPGICFSGANHQIKIVGNPWVKSEVEMNRMYNEATLTIVPSRQEAFGQVASESLMAGTPVASFSVGGLKDIVVNGFNGFTVDNLDTTEMAEKIDAFLYSNNIDTAQISEAAKMRFSEKSVVSAYLEILEYHLP